MRFTTKFIKTQVIVFDMLLKFTILNLIIMFNTVQFNIRKLPILSLLDSRGILKSQGKQFICYPGGSVIHIQIGTTYTQSVDTQPAFQKVVNAYLIIDTQGVWGCTFNYSDKAVNLLKQVTFIIYCNIINTIIL